jgi:hypothetical protein
MAKEKKPTESNPKTSARSRTKKPTTSATTGGLTASQPSSPAVRSDFVSAEEAVRRRAYELSLKRGANDGSPEEDWIRAEEEILGKRSA